MGRALRIICGVVLAAGLGGSINTPSASNREPPALGGQQIADSQDEGSDRRNAEERSARQQPVEAATVVANIARSEVVWAAVGALATAMAAFFAYFAWRNSNRALRIAVQGQRAHLLVECPRAGNFYSYPPKDPAFGYTLVNRGQSPAWIVSAGLKVIIGDLPDDPPLAPVVGERTIVIGPGQSEPFIEGLDFSDANFTNWRIDLYVVGWVKYRDIFETRETHFLFKFDPNEIQDIDKRMLPWGSEKWWRYS